MDQIKGASYSDNSFLEEGSILLLKTILHHHSKKFKPYISENDKTPNTDGKIEVLTESQSQYGLLDVQVKTLDKNKSKVSYSVELKLLAYIRDSSQVPFVLIVVDQNNKKAYWTHIDGDKAYSLRQKAVDRDAKRNKETTRITKRFKKTNLRFEKEAENENESEYKQTSQERFDGGILSIEDIDFIKEKQLKPYDIAMFSDGNYTSLSDIDIFEMYDKKQVSYNFKKILYNTLINKTKSINYFYSLYYHPGNVLSMIAIYRNDKELKTAIRSFKKFIDLSMFELNFSDV